MEGEKAKGTCTSRENRMTITAIETEIEIKTVRDLTVSTAKIEKDLALEDRSSKAAELGIRTELKSRTRL